ncbi:PAAR-like domain-containing protein [Archangium sp.]|uniref:PAAR-like domain-containing protein n=1 Tax=Archangium sp. TaxID=1872627 RepID=UPI002D2A7DE9|nr:PAAR-like domain-containing protein [Archangium sp.]HYO58685.1 PAAR-like domain-containing protein [Archangium sp.]
MTKVSVNAPRTPVTEGSSGIAAATLPNVCKMPGPPAPFVPTPLPNIGKSGTSPKGYSQTVTIEGKKVAIRGATFGSMGDVASKGTGGGIVSSNVEGATSFVGPGSMNVKMDGKNVQLLGDPMLNNCGPGGSPANAATMLGVLQSSGYFTYVTGEEKCPLCQKTHGSEAALEETPETRASVQRLANHLVTNKYANTTMLGVIQCTCKKYYANRSGITDKEFCELIKDSEWHGPQTGNAVSPTTNADDTADHPILAFLKVRFNQREDEVVRTWEEAAQRHKDFEDSKEDSKKRKDRKPLAAAYPPGSCAAPKILMLIMQDNGYPAGITEQWFHRKEKPTAGEVKYHDNRQGGVFFKQEQFAHGRTVPPCDTCDLLVPLMLCPDVEKMKCQHKAEEET